MSHYIDIFCEAAWSSTVIQEVCSAFFFLNKLLLPSLMIVPGFPSSEPTFFAMEAFGGFNMPLACVMAVAGATAGQLVNWTLGLLILKLKKRSDITIDDRCYLRSVSLFNKYGLFLLLFSWVPLCNLFVVLAGMANARLKLVLPLVAAGQVFAYGQYLL